MSFDPPVGLLSTTLRRRRLLHGFWVIACGGVHLHDDCIESLLFRGHTFCLLSNFTRLITTKRST